MPIVVRRGHVIAEPRSRLLRFERASIASASAAVGNEPLAPDPRHELARLALDVVLRTAEPVDLPPRWRGVPFAREVDRTRAQLVPIVSRAALLASFAGEASVRATHTDVAVPDPAQPPPGPVRVAYAIRWLELGDGRPRPAWEALVRGPVELVTQALAAMGSPPAGVSGPAGASSGRRDGAPRGRARSGRS